MKNNVTINMLYRFLACTLACLVSVFSYAADSLMSYVGCTPEAGSEIENFEFKLEFDFSKIIEANGANDYGIRIIGSATYHTSLYEGIGDDKVLLADALTTNINGTSADFVVGNILTINFPGIVPKPNANYTLVIANSFTACVKGESKAVTNTACNFQKAPLEYVYVGKASDASSLSIEDCSILNGTKLDVLNSVTYKFSAPISIVDGLHASLLLNDNAVASSSSIEVNDDTNELTVKFDDVVLYNQNTYTVTLPEGIVCMKDNTSSLSKSFSFNVLGSNFHAFGIKSSEPEENSTALTNAVKITFDLPADYKLLTSMGDSSNFSASLYKESVLDENLVKGDVIGNISSDGKGLEWSFGISPEPSTKYILYIPKFQFGAWKDSKVNDYSNDEILLLFSSPSVAGAGLEPLVFEAPVLNEHGKGETLVAGEKYASIGVIEIPLKGLNYYYDGHRQIPVVNTPLYVYDITDGNENLVQENSILVQQRETPTSYYPVLRVPINNSFFSGQKYKLVIPAGSISVSTTLIQKYATNTEWTFEFEGDTPLEVKLTDCTLQNDAELSELSAVVWKFKGEFVQNPDLTVQLMVKKPNPVIPGMFLSTITNAVTAVSSLSGNTSLVGAFCDS
ncbi:MAG: hypothetical protein K2N03_08840, partial [Muribaculaceae bacterium]|nr:hypothetical protein [Muribaculaceae bacterium]